MKNRDVLKEKWKEIFYGMAYDRFIKAQSNEEKLCENSENTKNKAKDYVIHQYRIKVFLCIVLFLFFLDASLLGIMGTVDGSSGIFTGLILRGAIMVLLYHFSNFVLKETIFRGFWSNVYKYKYFVEKKSLLKYYIG